MADGKMSWKRVTMSRLEMTMKSQNLRPLISLRKNRKMMKMTVVTLMKMTRAISMKTMKKTTRKISRRS